MFSGYCEAAVLFVRTKAILDEASHLHTSDGSQHMGKLPCALTSVGQHAFIHSYQYNKGHDMSEAYRNAVRLG